MKRRVLNSSLAISVITSINTPLLNSPHIPLIIPERGGIERENMGERMTEMPEERKSGEKTKANKRENIKGARRIDEKKGSQLFSGYLRHHLYQHTSSQLSPYPAHHTRERGDREREYGRENDRDA